MDDGHPTRALLLPDRHHAHRIRGQRLSRTRTLHGDGVGHNQCVGVQLGLDIAQRELVQLQLLQSRHCRIPVEPAIFGRDHDVVAGKVRFNRAPALCFHLFPETTFQTFAARRILETADLVLAPQRAPGEQENRGKQHDRLAIFHLAILQYSGNLPTVVAQFANPKRRRHPEELQS